MLNLSKISKYLSGEMDKNEEEKFKKRVNKSKKNEEFFNDTKRDWEMVGKYAEKEKYNVDSAWNKLHDRLENDNLLVSESKLKIDFYQVVKIAAIFIIGILISFFGYYAINNSSENNLILAERFESRNVASSYS